MQQPSRTQAFFLQSAVGQRLCLLHTPQDRRPRAGIVYAHPFAEEINKSRRMAAMQSRALADAGYAVLQIDMHGCGDSSGDLADASWSGWVDDLMLAVHWLRRELPAPIWLWGLRSGALLTCQAAQRLAQEGQPPVGLLWWQPAPAGKLLLQQFLRLRAAADMHTAAAKQTLQKLREVLAAGDCVDVAGYALPPAVAQGLEQAELRLDLPQTPEQTGGDKPPVIWLEVSSQQPPALLPVSATRVAELQRAGTPVKALAVGGPAFWQTQEIEDAPGLLAATLDALSPA